jgi:hypothetical protein
MQRVNQQFDFHITDESQNFVGPGAILKHNEGETIAAFITRISGTAGNVRVMLQAGGTPAQQVQYYSELMAELVRISAGIQSVVFIGAHELFSGAAYVPREAYFSVLRAPLSGDVAQLGVVINQVYGTGNSNALGSGAISHSFVELYNQTNLRIDLAGWSLQVQNGRMNSTAEHTLSDWTVIPFGPGDFIEPRSSFLILINDARPASGLGSIRYEIPRADIDMSGPRGDQAEQPIILSNRAFSVALVRNQTQLTKNIDAGERAGIVDLVGASNTSAGDVVENFEGAKFAGITQNSAARRINFADTDNNSDDFERLDYRLPASGMNNTELARVRPRSSHDGQWGTEINIPIFIPEDIPEAQRLTFSRDAGVHTAQFQLELETGYSNGEIWYTLDGRDPVPHSPGTFRYTAPFTIRDRTNDANVLAEIGDGSWLFGEEGGVWVPNRNDWGRDQGFYNAPNHNIFKSNVIRAQVFFADGTALTEPVTRSYIVSDDLYGMIGNLPIISLSADADDLFDPERGIFVNYNFNERGAEWERTMHMEFFDRNEAGNGWEFGFAQNLGVRVHGGWSRMQPQKSMRFYAGSGRHPNSPVLTYDLFDGEALAFDGSTIEEFRRFLLRNFGNDRDGAHMRDKLIHKLVQGLNAATQDSRYAVVMLNGEFWGLHELRERVDEHFVNSKFKLGNTNVAMLQNPEWGPPAPGEDYRDDFFSHYEPMRNWFQDGNRNLSSPAAYLEAQRYIDIDNLIDYFIVQTFMSNGDWPNNNTQIWRFQTAEYPAAGSVVHPGDGRWRYIFQDLDMTLSIYNNPYDFDKIDDVLKASWFSPFFRAFCTNDEFVRKFVSRYFDLMNTNLRESEIHAMADLMAGQIEAVVAQHRARWSLSDYSGWESEVNSIKNFATQRQGIVTGHIINQTRFASALGTATPATLNLQIDASKGHFRVNSIDVKSGTPGVADAANWSGTYLTGLTQTVTVIPERGYALEKFIVGGTDTAPTRGNTLEIVLNGNTSISAVFTEAQEGPEKDEIAAFRYAPGTADTAQSSYAATEGELKANAKLEFFYASGAQANIGVEERNPVNVPNNAGRWIPEAGAIGANNSAGWVITLDTVNYRNLTFTANQGSSNNGPRDFRLAYRIGTAGPWTEISTAHTPIISGADQMGNTFNGIPLPAAMENQPTVQLKVYISSNASRGAGTFNPVGGNTSINNIIFAGDKIAEQAPDRYDIGVGTFTGGTVTVGSANAPVGGTAVLTVTPWGGWRLKAGTLKFDNTIISGNSFTMPEKDVIISAEFELINQNMLNSPVIINQVYGVGTGGAISNSFIELYNTSNNDVSLSGLSIQVANPAGSNLPTGEWTVLPLTGVIRAKSYYLIVCTPTINTGTSQRYTIPAGEWDQTWNNGVISNRGYSVALVNGTARLSETITTAQWANIRDFAAAHNDAETIRNTLGAGTVRVSQNVAIRRVNFANTGNNAADFEALDYRATGISDTKLEEVRPRWSGPIETDFEVSMVISQSGGNLVMDWNLKALVENQNLRNLAGIRLSYDNTKLQLISGIQGVPIPLTSTMTFLDLDEDDAIASNLPLNWGAGTTMVAQGAGGSRGYITLEIQRTQSNLALIKDVNRRLARIQFAFRDNPAGGKYTMADLDENSIRFMTEAELEATEQANLVRFVTRANSSTVDVDQRYGALFAATNPNTINRPAFTWITGFTVTGQIRSYNPTRATTIELMQGGAVMFTGTIPAAGSGAPQMTQMFTIEGVAPGTYTLVVTKDAHTSFTITGVVVEDDLDLRTHSRSDISMMTMRSGDLDKSNNINQDDLAILINSANYGRSLSLARDILADLDGSGNINQDDLAILINSANYGRGAVVLNYALPGVGQ